MHNRLGGIGSSSQGLTISDFNNPALAMLQAQQHQALNLLVQNFLLY
jgi:hypothetical protein